MVRLSFCKFQNTVYLQEEVLAMGTLTSSVFSEIYLQFIENTEIYDILLESQVEGDFRYVDDILIVYRENHANINSILDKFNSILPSMKFTLEQEQDNRINFLDITVIKNQDRLSFDIYRKPTTTDSIIPNDSCHLLEQKLAAIRYLSNRIETYNLNHVIKQKESNTLKQIIHNNKYDISVLNKVNGKKGKQKQITTVQNGLSSHTLGKKLDLLLNSLKTLMSRLHLSPTTI
jgi:hypothetical protein